MIDLLPKKHHCGKIHTLLMKNIAYPPSSITPLPPFLQENLDPTADITLLKELVETRYP